MPRIVYPAEFAEQVALFKSIKQKHDADGPASPLIMFLSQNNIDLNSDDADADDASARHSVFDSLSKLAESLREQRDNALMLPWKNFKMGAQFLKALYPKNTRALGDWTITVNNKNKLVYPKKISERISLVKDFIAKHNSFAPGTSPLEIFLSENEIDFADDLAAVNSAETLHDEFASASRSKEEKREQRNLLWFPVMKNVRAMGGYLKTLFSNNNHKMGDYGFTINSPARQKKIRTTKLGAGASITLGNVVMGSTLSNLGNGELHLLKGRRKKSPPIIISGNTHIEVPKGCSTCHIYNPSAQENGIFTSFFYK
jgi:hypothetical protein